MLTTRTLSSRALVDDTTIAWNWSDPILDWLSTHPGGLRVSLKWYFCKEKDFASYCRARWAKTIESGVWKKRGIGCDISQGVKLFGSSYLKIALSIIWLCGAQQSHLCWLLTMVEEGIPLILFIHTSRTKPLTKGIPSLDIPSKHPHTCGTWERGFPTPYGQ